MPFSFSGRKEKKSRDGIFVVQALVTAGLGESSERHFAQFINRDDHILSFVEMGGSE